MVRQEKKQHQLTDGASMLLDIIRFTAAIAVLVTHSGEKTFGTGWKHSQFWGDLAVPVFFVLSGFVIRFVTRTREGNLREYYIDRASRIYSVAIPAMLLTLLCSLACLLLDRTRFLQDWSQTFSHPLARLIANLTFTSQIWGSSSIPFIDSPFWSLGYECPYYIFYGVIFFFTGWKRVLACALLAVISGPQILFLLPLWWAGVWIYDAYHSLKSRSAALFAVVGLFLWLGISLLPVFIGIGRLPIAIQSVFTYIATRPNPLELLGIHPHRASMFAYASGFIAAVLLLLALLAIEAVHLPISNLLASRIRRIADGTFILYLFHYPLLLLAAYMGLFRYQHNLTNLTVVIAIVILCVVFAGPLDALKRLMRHWLRISVPNVKFQPSQQP